MGEITVKTGRSFVERNGFMRHLINDVQALEQLIREDHFEKGIQRIGAEQELSLIGKSYEPSFQGPEILDKIEDWHFTTEIGRFNLEINLDPQTANQHCLRATEQQLTQLLQIGKDAAAQLDSRILLTGILPTVRYGHLLNDALTPLPRYLALNEIVRRLRGSDFDIHLLGVDELIVSLPSLAFEACNTSFQLHLQIDAKAYAQQYNWAQLIAAPVLAVSANSPLLFGRELWAETRIALFHQSVDMRTSSNHLREKQPRVFFGNRWLQHSITEIFKDNIARFPTILMKPIEENALEMLAAGKTPSLTALRVHNGTTYPWNRPCYGISNGLPHLRIECRYIPSGPTVLDEIANFAFWIGLMLGMPDSYQDFTQRMSFRSAKGNFYAAARTGLNTVLEWCGKSISASDLIINELLPIAKAGLTKIKIPAEEIARYLNCIEQRVAQHQNGALWQVRNFRRLREQYSSDAALARLTAAMLERQESGEPIHAWTDINLNATHTIDTHQETVGKIMTTDLFTVNQDEPALLVKSLMEWKNIRHLPIENLHGELVGLVTASNLQPITNLSNLPVRKIMIKTLVTIPPENPITEAVQIMKSKGIGCLPVVENGKMIGLITDTDLKRLNAW